MTVKEASGQSATSVPVAAPGPVFFTDIDGVMLPGRAYFMAGQTEPLQTTFDPCAVGMLNRLCRDLGGKVVIHSNWRNSEERRIRLGTMSLQEHFVGQGVLPEYLHEDSLCPVTGTRSRWDDIIQWLRAHPEVKDFWILEDTECAADWPHKERLVLCDFDEGLTVKDYMRIRAHYGKSQLILGANYGTY